MKTQTPTHTPTPWKVCGQSIQCDKGADSYEVARMPVLPSAPHLFWDQLPQNEADAAFIVRAVNAHEELVELIRSAIPWLVTSPGNPKKLVKRMEEAIAKAEGRD